MRRRRLAVRVRDLDVDDVVLELDPPADSEAAPAGEPRAPAATVRGTTVAALAPVGGSGGTGDGGGHRLEVVVDGWRFRLAVEPLARARLRDAAARAAAAHGPAAPRTVRAQIPGRVVSVAVAAGEHVEQGQALLAIEAMKMENEVRSPRAGIVEAIRVVAGSTVELGDELVRIS